MGKDQKLAGDSNQDDPGRFVCSGHAPTKSAGALLVRFVLSAHMQRVLRSRSEPTRLTLPGLRDQGGIEPAGLVAGKLALATP